jgi:hypothetical protein
LSWWFHLAGVTCAGRMHTVVAGFHLAGATVRSDPANLCACVVGTCAMALCAKGWYLGGKIEIMIGDKKVWAQAGLNLVVPGSKLWKP